MKEYMLHKHCPGKGKPVLHRTTSEIVLHRQNEEKMALRHTMLLDLAP